MEEELTLPRYQRVTPPPPILHLGEGDRVYDYLADTADIIGVPILGRSFGDILQDIADRLPAREWSGKYDVRLRHAVDQLIGRLRYLEQR